MFTIKDSALRIVEKLVTDGRTDPIVQRMPQNAGNSQQDQNQRQIQRSAFGCKRADREQQRVTWEKRSNHEARFRKDDQKEQGINPRTVRVSQLAEVQVEM